MALPPLIRVKLSSEAAESIALTRVVNQELPIRDLIEHLVAVAGKNEARICDLLKRGTVVSGASRFRWAGWTADVEDVRTILSTFPDADPGRAFDASCCVRAVLRGPRTLEIAREAGERKGLFQRFSFWDRLMEMASGGLEYRGYSYRDRVDRYARPLSPADSDRIRAACEAIRFSTLRDQVRTGSFNALELWCERK